MIFLVYSQGCGCTFFYPHACVYDTIYPIVSFSPIPEPVRTFNLHSLIVASLRPQKHLTGAFLKDTLFSNCQNCKPIVKIYTLYFNFRLRNYKNEVKYLIFFAFLVASFNFFCYLCIKFFTQGMKIIRVIGVRYNTLRREQPTFWVFLKSNVIIYEGSK